MADGKGTEPALLALCLDRKSGKILWTKSVGSGYKPGGKDGTILQLDSRSNYSSPSPVVSSKYVAFFYGNGDLLCFDHSGNLIWKRNIQKDYGDFCFQWTFSTSPTLFRDRLYLPVLQRDEQVHGRGVLMPSPLYFAWIWRMVKLFGVTFARAPHRRNLVNLSPPSFLIGEIF